MDFKSKDGKFAAIAAPFYEPARKTSADIINEARSAIREAQMGEKSFAVQNIKPLQTQRPFTPRNEKRILFEKRSNANRPPSSFSLRYLQNDLELSGPLQQSAFTEVADSIAETSTKKFQQKTRSQSLGEVYESKTSEGATAKVRLPTLDAKLTSKTGRFKKNSSLERLPEENEPGYKPDPGDSRKVYSSPQVRTIDYQVRPPEGSNSASPFGRASRQQQNLSQCLLLGPHNLNNKFFDNKHIIEHSDSLFARNGYINRSPPSSGVLKDGVFEKSVSSVLAQLNNSQGLNNEEIVELIDDLYDCMEKENFTKIRLGSKMKIQVLKCLYQFVESEHIKLLINTARVILAMKVTGNNLSGVCKLIFKVAKNDNNDEYFLDKNILELFVDALGRSSPLDDAEACVYGYGSIKFLTMNPQLLEKVLNLGMLHLMILHIKIINNARIDVGQLPSQANNALFQLTGALRNLASNEDLYENFVVSQAISPLCHTLDLFISDADIIGNISRTLSKLSTNAGCRDCIAEYPAIFRVFIKIFEKYPDNEDVIIRLTYTLGNIVAYMDRARLEYYNEKNAVSSLMNLWKFYMERTLVHCAQKVRCDEETTSSEDVLVKVIRIFANIVINPDIGEKLNHSFGKQSIEEFLKVLISNPFKKNDDLMLSILSTLNNFSFYYTTEAEEDIFHLKQTDIMSAIVEYVNSDNYDIAMESLRIMGNLSRSRITRNFIVESKAFATLIDFLRNNDINLLRTTVGVFVNLMADVDKRTLLKNHGGIAILIEAFGKYGHYDWSLSALICQVLWNFSIDSANLYDMFSASETQQIITILIDLLDEEKLFSGSHLAERDDEFRMDEYVLWEEFANVGTNLLDKMEQFLDNMDGGGSVYFPVTNYDYKQLGDKNMNNITFSAW